MVPLDHLTLESKVLVRKIKINQIDFLWNYLVSVAPTLANFLQDQCSCKVQVLVCFLEFS